MWNVDGGMGNITKIRINYPAIYKADSNAGAPLCTVVDLRFFTTLRLGIPIDVNCSSFFAVNDL